MKHKSTGYIYICLPTEYACKICCVVLFNQPGFILLLTNQEFKLGLQGQSNEIAIISLGYWVTKFGFSFWIINPDFISFWPRPYQETTNHSSKFNLEYHFIDPTSVSKWCDLTCSLSGRGELQRLDISLPAANALVCKLGYNTSGDMAYIPATEISRLDLLCVDAGKILKAIKIFSQGREPAHKPIESMSCPPCYQIIRKSMFRLRGSEFTIMAIFTPNDWWDSWSLCRRTNRL